MVNKREESPVAAFLSFLSRPLFFWYPKLDHPINDPDRIGRNVDNRRHLHGLSCPDIEFAAMPWTDNVKSFDIAITQRAIIVGADIGDRKKLTGDIDDHNRPALHFDEQTFPIGKVGSGSNIKKFSFRCIKRCIVEHGLGTQVNTWYVCTCLLVYI